MQLGAALPAGIPPFSFPPNPFPDTRNSSRYGEQRSASTCEPSRVRASVSFAREGTIPWPKPANGSSRLYKATSTTMRCHGNLMSLGVFRDRVPVRWWRTLRRPGRRRRVSWTRILAFARTWLAQPRVLHPFPDARFLATHLEIRSGCANERRPDLGVSREWYPCRDRQRSQNC